MLTPNDIADQLEKLIEEKFPGETVHRDLTPQGFTRPCSLIVQDGCEIEVGYGSNMVKLVPTFTLVTFVPVDEYHHSHMAEMHLRQMMLAELFLPGFIQVGDRAPKVENLTLEGGYDFDTVTVTFFYTLARDDFKDIPQMLKMLHLHLKEEVRTYG